MNQNDIIMEYDKYGRPKYDEEGNRIFYPKTFISASKMSKTEKEELQRKINPLEYDLKRKNLIEAEMEKKNEMKRQKQEIIASPPLTPIATEKLLNEPLTDLPVYHAVNETDDFSQSIFDSPGKPKNHTSFDENELDLSLFEKQLGGRKSKKSYKKKSRKSRKSYKKTSKKSYKKTSRKSYKTIRR